MRVASDRELSGLLGPVALCVAEVVEPLDELARRQRLPAAHLEGTGKHARIRALELAMQPGVDQARELDVVIGGDADRRAGTGSPDRQQDVELPAASPPLAGRPLGRGALRFGRDRRLRQSDTGLAMGLDADCRRERPYCNRRLK